MTESFRSDHHDHIGVRNGQGGLAKCTQKVSRQWPVRVTASGLVGVVIST